MGVFDGAMVRVTVKVNDGSSVIVEVYVNVGGIVSVGVAVGTVAVGTCRVRCCTAVSVDATIVASRSGVALAVPFWGMLQALTKRMIKTDFNNALVVFNVLLYLAPRRLSRGYTNISFYLKNWGTHCIFIIQLFLDRHATHFSTTFIPRSIG
jgi:hypothetical protein